MNTAEVEEWMKRMQSAEPLHPDLVPYLEEDGPFGKMVRHPLTYVIVGFSNGEANYIYEQKAKQNYTALAEGKWHTYVFLHERPHRLPALLAIKDQITDDEYFWELVGRLWTDSENIWQNQEGWAAILSCERPGRLSMMDEDEHHALTELPDEITIYRGCTLEVNEEGWSWTTDRARAEWFARRFRPDLEAVVIEARVSKRDVVAHFLGRNESEIVVNPDSVRVIQYRTDLD